MKGKSDRHSISGSSGSTKERMMAVMYKACIFDLDGTLTDTLESLRFSVNETMKEIGLEGISRDQCRKFVGNGASVLIQKVLKASGDENLVHFEEAMDIYRKIFDRYCMYQVKPYEGIPKLLEYMKSRGMKLGVLSNKPDIQAVHVVETVFGKQMFDEIQGQRPGIPRKPDPFAALAIAERFGVQPEETLYIGDSEVDAATGKAAGMDTVLVLWGFRSLEELSESEPDIMVKSTDEIIDLIEKQEEK